MTTLLIDGDIVCWRAACSAQHVYYRATSTEGQIIDYPTTVKRKEVIQSLARNGYDPEDWDLSEQLKIDPLEHALHSVKLILQGIPKNLNVLPRVTTVFLSTLDKSNFRYELATIKPYKGTRKVEKPHYFHEVRDYIKANWTTTEISGIEADDAIGIESQSLRRSCLDYYICSIDKDLDMLPGKHFDFVKNRQYEVSDPGFLEIYSREGQTKKNLRGGGIKWFYAQMLLGDSADNIPGIFGLGPVAVERELRECQTPRQMFDKVKQLYYTVYNEKTNESLLEVGNLLWIQRKKDQKFVLPKS